MVENNHNQVFGATPNNQEDIKKGVFQRFIDWFKGFGKKKYEQSEEFLAAKVEKEKAEAFRTRAEGMKFIKEAAKLESEANKNNAETFMKMKETVERFNEVEKQKMIDQGMLNDNGEAIEEKLDLKGIEELSKEIEEKMRLLKLMKGTEIKINTLKMEEKLLKARSHPTDLRIIPLTTVTEDYDIDITARVIDYDEIIDEELSSDVDDTGEEV